MVAPPRPVPVALLLACAVAVPGCAWAPKSRVDEAHKLVQTLRAENAQLKDSSLTLRVQNQELAQRAVDDARAIKALEVANDQFERSIQGYQDEREKMRAAFRDVERMARGDSRSSRAATDDSTVERFHALARALPGCSFEDASGLLTIPADALFPEGGSRPTPEGDAWLDELAIQVAASPPDRLELHLESPGEDASVRRASLDGGDAPSVTLAGKRARVLRDTVAARARIDPARIVVTTPRPDRPSDDVARGPGEP